MKIGQSICTIRKDNQLSQDQFADLFHVTRQTVSNWENEKSYPDLETILKISEQFHISVDTLLRSDVNMVKKMDNEKKKKGVLFILLLLVIAGSILTFICAAKWYEKKSEIAFTMERSQTYQTGFIENNEFAVQTGYFTLPKSGKVTIASHASTDDGELIIEIVKTADESKSYQITGQDINDKQVIYLESGSYTIQVTATDYTQNIVSLTYDIKINN